MAIADTKKCQTMINVAAQQITIVRQAIATLKVVRTAFVTIDPDTTSTPLDGNVAYVNAAINDLDDAVNTGANSTVWDQMIAAEIPSHRNVGLEV